MTDSIITSPDQLTAEWLTTVLNKSGALTSGEVSDFDLDRDRGNWSANGRLTVQYTADSTGARPEKLFLKIVNADLDNEFFGRSEVNYYTRDYVDVKEAPLLRCYDAEYSEAMLRYHLLLDDLSDSHIEAASKMPTLEYGLALAEGLAAMHARWWGEEGLAEAEAPIHTAEHIRRFVDLAEPGATHIINGFAHDLEPLWPNFIRELYANHPQVMIDRCQDTNGFSLIHGDVGQSNILVPRESDRPIYIIDRQPFNWSLTTWLGVYDLAYAMVLDWYVETRRRLELPVLRHYYQRLLAHGVVDYSWQQLWYDYRLAVAMCVYVATEYCRGGINSRMIWLWLPMLQRTLTACDDLNCRELWAAN